MDNKDKNMDSKDKNMNNEDIQFIQTKEKLRIIKQYILNSIKLQ